MRNYNNQMIFWTIIAALLCIFLLTLVSCNKVETTQPSEPYATELLEVGNYYSTDRMIYCLSPNSFSLINVVNGIPTTSREFVLSSTKQYYYNKIGAGQQATAYIRFKKVGQGYKIKGDTLTGTEWNK